MKFPEAGLPFWGSNSRRIFALPCLYLVAFFKIPVSFCCTALRRCIVDCLLKLLKLLPSTLSPCLLACLPAFCCNGSRLLEIQDFGHVSVACPFHVQPVWVPLNVEMPFSALVLAERHICEEFRECESRENRSKFSK